MLTEHKKPRQKQGDRLKNLRVTFVLKPRFCLDPEQSTIARMEHYTLYNIHTYIILNDYFSG